MKGNSKKLAVFVSIAAIAMFTVVPMASAHWNVWNYIIQGDYAVTGANNCVLSAGAPFTASPPFYPTSTLVQISTGFIEGVYKFHVDGTGSFKGLVHTNTSPALGPHSITAGLGELNYEFTYTVGDGGVITFLLNGTCGYTSCAPIVNGFCTGLPIYLDNVPKYGVISFDGMNINVTCGVPIFLTVQGGCPNANPGVPAGSQLSCNISLAGFKVPKTIQLPTY
jgi:hypothetical protein